MELAANTVEASHLVAQLNENALAIQILRDAYHPFDDKVEWSWSKADARLANKIRDEIRDLESRRAVLATDLASRLPLITEQDLKTDGSMIYRGTLLRRLQLKIEAGKFVVEDLGFGGTKFSGFANFTNPRIPRLAISHARTGVYSIDPIRSEDRTDAIVIAVPYGAQLGRMGKNDYEGVVPYVLLPINALNNIEGVKIYRVK